MAADAQNKKRQKLASRGSDVEAMVAATVHGVYYFDS